MATAEVKPFPVSVPNPGGLKTPVPKPKKQIPSALSLAAGALGGATEAAVTYPFEFSKTRAQLPEFSGARKPGVLTILSKVAKEDGVRAIYTGCSTLIVGTAFKAGVRFLTYDSIKNMLADESGKLSMGRGIVAGMAAGSVEAVVAVAPTERIKTALIDDARGQRRFHGGLHAARVLMQEQGVSALYRGLVSTIAKQSATSATRMGTYNALKETANQFDLPNNAAVTFANGAIAGTVAVYASQPFDTVKTRAQSTTGSSIQNACRDIIREGGLSGFWAGSTMRLGRLVLSGGIVFSVYEAVVGLFM